MIKRLQAQKTLIKTLSRFYCNGTGSGTVKNPDVVFSDREAAMENKYFREKTLQDLKRLKKELVERQRNKQQYKDRDEVEDAVEPEKPPKEK